MPLPDSAAQREAFVTTPGAPRTPLLMLVVYFVGVVFAGWLLAVVLVFLAPSLPFTAIGLGLSVAGTLLALLTRRSTRSWPWYTGLAINLIGLGVIAIQIITGAA